MPGTTTATWRAVVRSPNTSAARPSPAGSKSRKRRSGSSSSSSLRRRASESRHARRAQPRDLVLDRLARWRRSAAPIGAPSRLPTSSGRSCGERLGDRGVERLEERRDRGRVGVAARAAPSSSRGGALDAPARSSARGRRAGAAAAGDLADRARPPRRRSGARARRRRARRRSTATTSSMPAYSAVTCPRSRRSMSVSVAPGAAARESRGTQLRRPAGPRRVAGPGSAICPCARARLKPRPRGADDSRMSQRGEDDRRAIAASAAAIYVGAAFIGLVEAALPGGEPFSLVPGRHRARPLGATIVRFGPRLPRARARRARPARRGADRRRDRPPPTATPTRPCSTCGPRSGWRSSSARGGPRSSSAGSASCTAPRCSRCPPR